MKVYSIADIAEHLTAILGEYISVGRVSVALHRLVEVGALVERRAGRCRVLLDEDLSTVESHFGITQDMLTAHQQERATA